MVNMILNIINVSDVWFVIAYIIALAIILVPLVVGIPMCLKNKTLTSRMKAVWVILLIWFGIIAFIIYCILYKSKKPIQQ